MKYTIDKREKLSIFKVSEENLNSLIAPNLKSEFIFLRNEGVRNLVLDLSEVKYVDSSGLSAILTASRLWKGYGSFVITGVVHPTVKKLIEISRLETILTIIPTLEEAEEYVILEEIERNIDSEEE